MSSVSFSTRQQRIACARFPDPHLTRLARLPLSYVTGTLVKMGQGIERHIAGGKAADWLGYFLLFASFVLGATVGGCISVLVNGTGMLAVATVVCALTTGYTYFHQDRRALLD